MFYLDKSRMILHSLIIITHRQRDLLADYFFARKGFAPEDAHKCSSYHVIELLGSTSGRYPADRVYIEWIANWCRHCNPMNFHEHVGSPCIGVRENQNTKKHFQKVIFPVRKLGDFFLMSARQLRCQIAFCERATVGLHHCCRIADVFFYQNNTFTTVIICFL